MRRGLDTSKAVKRVLPKHKHHFESLFEYKSDDEDANDSDSDRAGRCFGSATREALGSISKLLKTFGEWRFNDQKDTPSKGKNDVRSL